MIVSIKLSINNFFFPTGSSKSDSTEKRRCVSSSTHLKQSYSNSTINEKCYSRSKSEDKISSSSFNILLWYLHKNTWSISYIITNYTSFLFLILLVKVTLIIMSLSLKSKNKNDASTTKRKFYMIFKALKNLVYFSIKKQYSLSNSKKLAFNKSTSSRYLYSNTDSERCSNSRSTSNFYRHCSKSNDI